MKTLSLKKTSQEEEVQDLERFLTNEVNQWYEVLAGVTPLEVADPVEFTADPFRVKLEGIAPVVRSAMINRYRDASDDEYFEFVSGLIAFLKQKGLVKER